MDKCAIDLGIFYDTLLRTEANPACIDKHALATLFAEINLKCIVNGQSAAIDLFPRILDLLEEYSNTHLIFSRFSANVPEWIYLKWLPQVLAAMDKKGGKLIIPTILKLGELYPGAIYSPLRISLEQYKYQHGVSKSEVGHLKSQTHSNALELIEKELMSLTEPQHVFKDLVEQIQVSLTSMELSSLNSQFERLVELCNNTQKNARSDAFLAKHKKRLLKIIGSNCSNLKESPTETSKKLVEYYKEQIHSDPIPSGRFPVSLYSSWMANFRARDFDIEIEIPGQFDDVNGPIDRRNITYISGFGPDVLVMSSLRRPKKIIIVGTDEKEYPFLVKGGEDLRLDQRVQQLFRLMNHITAGSTYCKYITSSVITYKVIPLSCSLGVIEWLDHTKPLRACLMDMPGFSEAFVKAQQEHQKFISRKGNSSNDGSYFLI
jgi:hypothetical protein